MKQFGAKVDLTDSNKDTYINKDFIYINGRKMERSIKTLSLEQYMNSSEVKEFYMNSDGHQQLFSYYTKLYNCFKQ